MHKSKGPPDLDKYLEGRKHKYMTYQQAARHYGLPYWGFVKVAKEGKAACAYSSLIKEVMNNG